MPAGELHFVFEFEGPMGVRYPQNQPTVDSFDETERVQILSALAEEEAGKPKTGGDDDGVPPPPDVLATDIMARGSKPEVERSTEFSDAEIEAAFKFIDLDKNGFVGSSEIRHILVCMGELITDEEVDMMIKMVDMDGDGQVTFSEFYDLVTDPDPARPDFGQRPEHVEMGGSGAVHDRQKDMQSREEKRRMLAMLVKDNSIGQGEVMSCYEQFALLKRPDDIITFDLFCELLQIEPTGEYRRLFELFDGDNSGSVDIKELVLGLMNFVTVDTDVRCSLIFSIYDTDKSGFLSMDELLNILSANHMTTKKNVAKKAATVMKQGNTDGEDGLSLEEFTLVSEKFPNILFPPTSRDVPEDPPPPPPAPP